MLDKLISIMIMGKNQNVNSSLGSDLELLGFRPLLARYPDADTNDIT